MFPERQVRDTESCFDYFQLVYEVDGEVGVCMFYEEESKGG